MDFRLTEGQQTVSELARSTFDRHGDPRRLATIEAGQDRIYTELWRDLAAAGVLGLAIPEDLGGAGLNPADVVPIFIEQGRRVPLVPLWETVALGAYPIARYGNPEQQRAWLPRVADGSVFLSAALEGPGGNDPSRSAVVADSSATEVALTGTAVGVRYGHLANALVVAATRTDGSLGLFLVDTAQNGVRLETFANTDRGLSADVHFDHAVAQALDSGPDEDRVQWLLQQAWIGLAGIQLGVSQESVRQTASYVSEREQFGVPLGTFQAVAHQAANCHIDTEAMEVTFWNAVWRNEVDRRATAAVHVAKWWAADAGDRVARTVQHLHGGLGADITYPIHRYMLWTSQLANTLGSAEWHLSRIGNEIAEARV